MNDIRVRLIEKIVRTPTVESFRFQPERKVVFLPGQFTQLVFNPDRRDDKELNKYLSFSCSPDKPYVEVTKRLSDSAFSRRLRGLLPGDEVLIRPPMGACVFKEEQGRIGFLIGGIGITPVISIVEYITDRGLATDIELVYSNRTEEEIAFRKELDGWRSRNPGFKICYLVSDSEPRDTVCVRGVICKEVLKKQVCDVRERTIFIFGPPRMVESMTKLAREMECKPENIKTETFVGYE